MKYALTQVLTGSRCTGVRTDGKLLVSQQGHYTMKNATDWTGLGMDNIIEIETDEATNAMSLRHLEEVLKELQAQGTPVVSVVCTMGTTDAFAMDPVAGVRKLIDRYPNPEGFGKPFLYCDAVIGWSWLTFGTYDFEKNPMGFSGEVLPLIRKNLENIREVVHADAIGCDFHKVGWSPYNSSIVMIRDYNHFRRLMTRPGSDYLQERTCYNPGLYTLEVSRSGSYSMAAWATLKFFGHEGFQAVLGGILEMEHYLRSLLAENPSLVCVNEDDHGFVTLFRVYPEGVDAKEQYRKELTDPAFKQDLIRNNDLQERVANRLWSWFRDGHRHHGAYAPYTSYSTGFRPAAYNRDESDQEAMVYALKSFPMNLNIGPSSMQTLVDLVLAARDEVAGEKDTTPKPGGNCPLPYSQGIDGIDCQAEQSGRSRAAEDLLSGVVRRRS